MSADEHREVFQLLRERTQLQRQIRASQQRVSQIEQRIRELDARRMTAQTYIRQQLGMQSVA